MKPSRKNLTAQIDQLRADLIQAGEALDIAAAAAAEPLRRREYLRTAMHISNPGHASDEESELLGAHREAEARVVALEDALRDAERDLAAIDGEAKAMDDGKAAEAAIAQAETRAKTARDHQAKVVQLKAKTQGDLEAAIRRQQQAEQQAAQEAVQAALAGLPMPTPAPDPENAVVARLEAMLAQIDVAMRAAEADAADAQRALDDLAHPVWHGRYTRHREALRSALDKAMPHLHDFMTAQAKLGWGYYLPSECDLDTTLRSWRQAQGLPV